MNIYISIGSHCTTPALFDLLGVKKESLPFDWMFSTPEFVYTILKLLLIDAMEIDTIVDTYFLVCDRRATYSPSDIAHYINTPDGNVLINSKYNVAFPHDSTSDREKYIRRLERLKRLLLDESNFIYFVYVSIPHDKYFIVNEVEPIKDLYEYVEKIHDTIRSVRTKYKILIFDIYTPKYMISSDSIIYYTIQTQDQAGKLLPELNTICNTLLSTNVIQR
jgi:hypothetical protein